MANVKGPTVRFRSFAHLVKNLSDRAAKYRLLFVFIKATPVEASGDSLFPDSPAGARSAWTRIIFDAHQQLSKGLTFEKVVANADRHSSDWDLVAIAPCNNRDNSLPSVEQANKFLGSMKAQIAKGGLGGFIVFNRSGSPLRSLGSAQIGKPPSAHQN